MLIANVYVRQSGYHSVANEILYGAVQFCGNDPQTVLAAAKYVEGHCDAVDLNLGCPQVWAINCQPINLYKPCVILNPRLSQRY